MIEIGSVVFVDVAGVVVEKFDQVTQKAIEHFAFSGGLLKGTVVRSIAGPPASYEIDVPMVKLFSGTTITVKADKVVRHP